MKIQTITEGPKTNKKEGKKEMQCALYVSNAVWIRTMTFFFFTLDDCLEIGSCKRRAKLPWYIIKHCRSRWPRALRPGPAAARLVGLRFRIPPGVGWISVSSECCVLSGRDLCDEPITPPEEFYRL